MMTDGLLEELVAARKARKPCALVTVAETKGSVPRAAGAKMLVYLDGLTSGTIGGGKFEALVGRGGAGRVCGKKDRSSRLSHCAKTSPNLSARSAAGK